MKQVFPMFGLLPNVSTTFLLLVLSLSINLSYAENNCAAISCDCAVLPMDSWKSVCKERELKLRARCRTGIKSVPLYCAAHGPAANSLALDLNLSTKIDLVEEEKIPVLSERVASLYWSVHSDLHSVRESLKTRRAASAVNKTTVITLNVENLFVLQQQITRSWVALKRESRATGAWENYASDSLDMADGLLKLGKYWWNESFKAEREFRLNKKNAALALILASGRAYEHSAYAFGMASEHDNAARAWKRAAEVSELMIKVKNMGNTDTEEVRRYKYQRAARLYRASYHWIKDDREGEAENSLEKARKVMEGAGGEDLG